MRHGTRLTALLVVASIALGCGAGDTYRLAGHDLQIPTVRLEPVAGETRGPVAGPIRALVDLSVQVDLERLGRELDARGYDREEQRRLVVTALGHLAEQSQAPLRRTLERLSAAGAVTHYRSVSIVNRLLVEGSAEAILELASRADVASIDAEWESAEPSWASGGRSAGPAERSAAWALEAIGAGHAWARGLDGEGIVVGIIDSGASSTHEQLSAGFLGGERGWRDPHADSSEPTDGAFGHGSGVLSTAVGANVGGVTLGVAPGAGWTACAALPKGRYNNVLMTACADWMLTVGQPDVLINAWYLPRAGCDRSLERIIDAWRAAEILPVFAAGNEGPEPGRDHSPTNYTDAYPGGHAVLSVGGLLRGGELFPLSTPGPNSCDPETIFPVLTAPAEDLLVALPLTTSSYRRVEGTSFAAGLVGGAAAVLLQAFPESSVSELEQALRDGAADLGVAGPDHVYGYGRLDLPGALEALAAIRGRSEP